MTKVSATNLHAVSPNTPDMHHIFQTPMPVKAKVAITLLLILIVWSISSSSLWSLPSVLGRATGCPMHRQSIPPSSPTTPNCCRASGDVAVLQKAANPKPDVATFALVTSDQEPIPQDFFALISDEAASPGTPPAKLQLRI
jgi:hypothetical protein